MRRRATTISCRFHAVHSILTCSGVGDVTSTQINEFVTFFLSSKRYRPVMEVLKISPASCDTGLQQFQVVSGVSRCRMAHEGENTSNRKITGQKIYISRRKSRCPLRKSKQHSGYRCSSESQLSGRVFKSVVAGLQLSGDHRHYKWSLGPEIGHSAAGTQTVKCALRACSAPSTV